MTARLGHAAAANCRDQVADRVTKAADDSASEQWSSRRKFSLCLNILIINLGQASCPIRHPTNSRGLCVTLRPTFRPRAATFAFSRRSLVNGPGRLAPCSGFLCLGQQRDHQDPVDTFLSTVRFHLIRRSHGRLFPCTQLRLIRWLSSISRLIWAGDSQCVVELDALRWPVLTWSSTAIQWTPAIRRRPSFRRVMCGHRGQGVHSSEYLSPCKRGFGYAPRVCVD